MINFAPIPLETELAAVLRAASDVDEARNAVAAAEVWRDIVVDEALAAGYSAIEVMQLARLR